MNTTLQYYQQNAEAFLRDTALANMDDTHTRFLKCLPPRGYILDFGCGSGRDAKAFLELGYRVDAVDGSEKLCRLASKWTGIPVKQMLFQQLSAKDTYDGIWACASILHLPRKELAEVLKKIAEALKIGGVLYTSFKYGDFEGMRNGRYFTNLTEYSLTAIMAETPSLQVFDSWITQDVRPGREEERWINILAKRI